MDYQNLIPTYLLTLENLPMDLILVNELSIKFWYRLQWTSLPISSIVLWRYQCNKDLTMYMTIFKQLHKIIHFSSFKVSIFKATWFEHRFDFHQFIVNVEKHLNTDGNPCKSELRELQVKKINKLWHKVQMEQKLFCLFLWKKKKRWFLC